MSSVAQHDEPVWRDQSDFVVAASLPGDGSGMEQIFARQLGPYRFEVCCIPFFVYDVALGDVVETDETYLIRRVAEPSGRFVFRVWFGGTAHPRDEVAEVLIELGGLLERSSVNLLGVDAENLEVSQRIAEFLASAADDGKLMFETGRS